MIPPTMEDEGEDLQPKEKKPFKKRLRPMFTNTQQCEQKLYRASRKIIYVYKYIY